MPKPATTSAQARRIVEQGSNIRSQMHDLVSTALADGKLDLTVARDAARGVSQALGGSIPADHANVLRQVFDGMTEAVAAAATAASNTLDHAAKAGKRLSAGELTRLRDKLSSLEHEFLAAVRTAGSDMSGRAGAEWKRLVDESKTAGTAIRPAAGKALSAAAAHAPTLAVETMKAGARAARTLGGEIAMGLSGVLSGVGQAIRGKPAPKKPAKKPAKKAAKKATPKKKAAKKRSARK